MLRVRVFNCKRVKGFLIVRDYFKLIEIIMDCFRLFYNQNDFKCIKIRIECFRIFYEPTQA